MPVASTRAQDRSVDAGCPGVEPAVLHRHSGCPVGTSSMDVETPGVVVVPGFVGVTYGITAIDPMGVLPNNRRCYHKDEVTIA
jgi:hypothetical protein